MEFKLTKWENCPDSGCETPIGSLHKKDCSIARCKEHGEQLIGCLISGLSHSPTTFKGTWPGEAEAVERGWFAYFDGSEWQECSSDHPEAKADLNRFYENCRNWNKDLEIFE